MQRGYQPALNKLAKDRSKAKANAKRAFTAYRKLNPIQRMTAKGRKKWKLYKNHEASDYVPDDGAYADNDIYR